LLKSLALDIIEDLKHQWHEAVVVWSEFLFNQGRGHIEKVQNFFLEWFITGLNSFLEVYLETSEKLVGIKSQDFSRFFGLVDFLVIFDNEAVGEVNKAGEAVSLELEALLFLNDLEKGWHELLVVLLLG
tara:strand:+ start:213 stop:599 length:387 start_codon:yes stop_codon:yes gene_type:complete